jgi:hypothetical protein
MFFLRDHVDDVPFEEQTQQFDEGGKWTSLPTYSIFVPIIA